MPRQCHVTTWPRVLDHCRTNVYKALQYHNNVLPRQFQALQVILLQLNLFEVLRTSDSVPPRSPSYSVHLRSQPPPSVIQDLSPDFVFSLFLGSYGTSSF